MLEITTPAQTMTSLEIATLVDSRHDKVKQSIERLVERGAISKPPAGDWPKSANGVVTQVNLIGKRDSYVIVAQLSPESSTNLIGAIMSDQIHTVAPSPSLETLSEAIRSIDQCSQECFSEISAVAQLALASLESPEAYRNLDSLTYALRAIWGRAEEAQNLVNDQASEVGCGYVDEAKRRRWAAHAAARQHEPRHA